MIDLVAQPIVLSPESIMLALRLVALALGKFRPFSQVFDLTSDATGRRRRALRPYALPGFRRGR